jgi:ParB family chromosome partitioning protein
MSTATTSQPTAPPNSATSTSSLQIIPLSHIVPSKTNPRKTFAGPEFDELVESIRMHGVLQPVLVRPMFDGDDGDLVHYELVAGERRFRASTAAEKSSIPAMVQILTDDQAMELQVIENMQRKDVTALEEANGFRALHALLLKDNPKLTHTELVQTIATRIGKSVRYVWARLKLNELIPELQQDLIAGRIQASHADELVRLCAKDQQELRDDHLFDTSMDDADDEHAVAHSVRQLKEIIAEHYQLELTKPPFPPEDTRLAPGPCSSCLKNSKNSPLADAVGKKVETCMDRACFAKKREQFVAIGVKDAKKIPEFLATKPVLKVTTQHHLTHGRAKGHDAVAHA